tara:strand:- start:1221 stop:1427 length:207 start_codon:yes stop_codon:yes gene_type:complete
VDVQYCTKVIETNKIRLKGEDISSDIARVMESEVNSMNKKGWKLFSVTPSLMTEGAIRKLILCFERKN